jgi:hypothetical protein
LYLKSSEKLQTLHQFFRSFAGFQKLENEAIEYWPGEAVRHRFRRTTETMKEHLVARASPKKESPSKVSLSRQVRSVIKEGRCSKAYHYKLETVCSCRPEKIISKNFTE